MESPETSVAISTAPTSPPRMEEVTRSQRQPTNRTPSKTDTDSEPATKSAERYIRWRPDRTIKRIPVRRTRPPSPAAIDIHPAAVVIRRPSPIIVRNPCPAPIRLVHPTPVAIRSPARRLRWTPHWTIIRNLRPRSVTIEVFRSHVIIVRVLPRFRIVDHVVAIRIPLIPVIPCRGVANLVLRIGARTLNRDELSLRHARAALRSRNFNLALAHQHFRMIVRGH